MTKIEVNNQDPVDLLCFRCKHFGQTEDGFACAAFPDGIPWEITEEDWPQYMLLPFQENDIVFEQID